MDVCLYRHVFFQSHAFSCKIRIVTATWLRLSHVFSWDILDYTEKLQAVHDSSTQAGTNCTSWKRATVNDKVTLNLSHST